MAQCGFELCRSILLAVREARASRPDLVVKYGCYLLHNYAQRLGHEVWAMYEQVDVALLQAGKRIGKHSTTDSSELALARQFSATLCASRQLTKACRALPHARRRPHRARRLAAGQRNSPTRSASSGSRACFGRRPARPRRPTTSTRTS